MKVVALLLFLASAARAQEALTEPGQAWAAPNGAIYVAASNGVWQVDPGQAPVLLPGSPTVPAPLLAGSGGALAVARPDVRWPTVHLLQADGWTESPPIKEAEDLVGLAVIPSGRVLAADARHGLFSWSPGEEAWAQVGYAGWNQRANALLVHEQGLWVLGWWQPTSEPRRPLVLALQGERWVEVPLPAELVWPVVAGAHDGEALWVLTSGAELARLDGSEAITPLPIEAPQALVSVRPGLLAVRGGDDVLLVRGDEGSRTPADPAGRGLAATPDGRVWAPGASGIQPVVPDEEGWASLRARTPVGARWEPELPGLRFTSGAATTIAPPSPAFFVDVEGRLLMRRRLLYEGAAYVAGVNRVELGVAPVLGLTTGVDAGGLQALFAAGGQLGLLWPQSPVFASWGPRFLVGRSQGTPTRGLRHGPALDLWMGALHFELEHEWTWSDRGDRHVLRAGVGTDLFALVLFGGWRAIGNGVR